VTAISAGGQHTCAIADGRAYCWGKNGRGQLGNNSTKDSLVPVAVSTSGVLRKKRVTAIDAGYKHTCVVADGRAYCWGWNKRGAQLGNNSKTDSSVPVAVSTSGVLRKKKVTAISAGGFHTCVVADGRAYCWGANLSAQLGSKAKIDYADRGSWVSRVPVAVYPRGVLRNKKVTAISAGNIHTCAVAEGSVYCWGDNYYGQLGNNGDPDDYFRVPVAVDTAGVLAGTTVTSVSAGQAHSCAMAEGRAYCWGSGPLGNASTTSSSMPVAVDTSGVLAGRSVTSISAGALHTCAVADGQAYCWGDNYYFQLGQDSTRDSWVPVAVDTSGVLDRKAVTAISAGSLHTAVVFGPVR
jgi:alpha-tubulin suppressor-like RCC1 family protein